MNEIINIFSLVDARENDESGQLIIAQIIYDLSLTSDNLLCNPCMVDNVISFIKKTNCESAIRLCIMAIINLSKFHCWQVKIIKGGLIPYLISYAVNDPYLNHNGEIIFGDIEISTGCARTVAHIASHLAADIIQNVKHDILIPWMNNVDHLLGYAMKTHAKRARDYLLEAMSNTTCSVSTGDIS